MKLKHVPIRTCIACRTSGEKRGLLRVVRQSDGMLCYDAKGKLPGRGAYVCADHRCIEIARKQKKLERALRTGSVSDAVFLELSACVADGPSGDIAAAPDILRTLDNNRDSIG